MNARQFGNRTATVALTISTLGLLTSGAYAESTFLTGEIEDGGAQVILMPAVSRFPTPILAWLSGWLRKGQR